MQTRNVSISLSDLAANWGTRVRVVSGVYPAATDSLSAIVALLRPCSVAILAGGDTIIGAPGRAAQNSILLETIPHLSIELMERYALKEVFDLEIRRFEKHISTCPKCKDFLIGEVGWALAMRSPTMAFIRKTVKAERKNLRKAETCRSDEPQPR